MRRWKVEANRQNTSHAAMNTTYSIGADGLSNWKMTPGSITTRSIAMADMPTARMPGPKPPARTLAAIARESGINASWRTTDRQTKNSTAVAATTSRIASAYGLHSRRGIGLRAIRREGSTGAYHATRQ